ncbi:midline-1-like protein [Aphelenchoides avenae]|nr:midline-1-like protein [Aphelenchus avenae]
MFPTTSSYTEPQIVVVPECTVCLDMYRDPLTLPSCGHSVCSACAQQLIANTTSPGNVVCLECRAHSPVTPGGFPRNYGLAGIIATLEDAGYRDTSQCSDCRSQVPNRRLRECVTCAREGSLLFCADCALRRHKDHDLVEFRGPLAPVPRTPSVRAVAPNRVTIDGRIPAIEDGERERQRSGTYRQPVVEGDHRRRCERNQSRNCCGHFKAAILTPFGLLCIPMAAFAVCVRVVVVGPLNALALLVLGLVIYGIAVSCHIACPLLSRESALVTSVAHPGNASKMASISSPHNKSQDCPVCLEMYRDPLTLSACGHSVCSACVHQLIANTTAPGNVVCPECRVQSTVTPNGFPRNYRLADMMATLEAAGYRETSQCSGCQSQVPNRSLRQCKTCSTEGSLLLCADCALRRHKDHDLGEFRGPPAPVAGNPKAHDFALFRGPPPSVPGTPSVRAVASNPLTIDEGIPLLEDLCERFKAALVAVIKVVFASLYIALAVFIVFLLCDLMGPWNALKVLAFGLAIYAICACCLYDDSKETYIKVIVC